MENFEDAFRSGGGGCREECKCGKVFYNSNGGWDWEDGELEGLEKSKATDLDWSVLTIIIDGDEYVMDCDCWHNRAKQMMGWMESHNRQFVKYLQLEKERKQIIFENAINPSSDIIYQYGHNAWKAMAEAPKGKTVEVLMTDEETIEVAHWASDLSGEEQPAFEGWFVRSGKHSYSQIKNPVSWREINKDNSTLLSAQMENKNAD